MGQEISLFFLFLGVLGFVSFIFILCVLGMMFLCLAILCYPIYVIELNIDYHL